MDLLCEQGTPYSSISRQQQYIGQFMIKYAKRTPYFTNRRVDFDALQLDIEQRLQRASDLVRNDNCAKNNKPPRKKQKTSFSDENTRKGIYSQRASDLVRNDNYAKNNKPPRKKQKTSFSDENTRNGIYSQRYFSSETKSFLFQFLSKKTQCPKMWIHNSTVMPEIGAKCSSCKNELDFGPRIRKAIENPKKAHKWRKSIHPVGIVCENCGPTRKCVKCLIIQLMRKYNIQDGDSPLSKTMTLVCTKCNKTSWGTTDIRFLLPRNVTIEEAVSMAARIYP